MNYSKQDTDYIVVQQRSLAELVDEVNKILEKHHTHDKSYGDNVIVMRVEGGILREDSLGTYTQVIVTTEYIPIAECL